MSVRIAFLISFLFLVGFQIALAQNDVSGKLIHEKFTQFTDHHLQEKIFIHTDRNAYLTGEHIWLKLYCADGTDHHSLNLSKVAYVELLDENNEAVIQIKVGIDKNGSGTGTIFLPISIKSANYSIRAYTSWMKNFSPDMYFQQLITVVNPFTKLPEVPVSSSPKYDVQFFPEGGNLVNGIRSTVAFRAVDENGSGIDFDGVIVSQIGDTLASIKPLKFGMGRFALKPETDHQFKAVITDSNQDVFTYNLPRALKKGYVLNLIDTLGKITVRVTTNLQNDASLHLLAHTRQRVNVVDTKQLQRGQVVFTFNRNLLQEGISHITIFNEHQLPVCERLVFIKPIRKLKLDIDLEEVNYSTRGKVTLGISNSLPDGVNTTANLSLSVFRLDSMQSVGPNIVNYLFLTSELRGNIESPDYYFEQTNIAERAETSDNLMLTQGWSRFKWDDVFTIDRDVEYVPELNGHLIHGHIREKSTQTAGHGVLTFLSFIGFHGNSYVSRGDEEGKLMFEVGDYYGTREVVVSSPPRGGKEYDIEIYSPFSDQASSLVVPPFRLSQSLKEIIEQQSIHMQVLKIFHGGEMSSLKKTNSDSMAFYGIPHERYDLDDFTRFKTMEEVMREYISGVVVRRRDDGWHFYNYDRGVDVASTDLFTTDPLVLLDGLPVFNVDDIMALDPLLVEYIEVVTRRYQQGVSSFDGIIHFKTYDGDLAGYQPDPKNLIVEYEGLNLEREFFSPLYETPLQLSSTIPDTRSLLYWSPSLTSAINENTRIEFYTSDISGKYIIVVQGIDKEGNPGYSSATFEVTRAEK